MRIIKVRDYQDMSRKAANVLSAQIILKPNSVLGLATGSTPIGLYDQLVDWYGKGDLDFALVKTVNLDEYVGLPAYNDQSYRYFMEKHLYSRVNLDPQNVNIPNGMTMVEKENKGWNIKGRKAIITTDTIKPGKIAEYTVVLTWDNSNSNFGTKKNVAKIVDTKNAAGFEEKSLEDNEDDAQFIISVSTGVKTAVNIAGFATIVLLAIGVCIVAVKRKI